MAQARMLTKADHFNNLLFKKPQGSLPAAFFMRYKICMSKKSEKFFFQNSRGLTLAGVLESPADTTPVSYAVFAPCFTCLKESHGAVKISRGLLARGIAVLRFDVTGLGGSEGVFAETNFTTRVDDLVSACRAMEQSGFAPSLLIGHSISGTAALGAAKHLPQLRAIATVGSPSDPSAVMDKFEKNNLVSTFDDRIEINVLGTQVPFALSFPNDLRSQNIAADTGNLTQHLYIFHAPNDNIVKYENAQVMHDRATSAAHREIITLSDTATHLFEKGQDDAIEVANKLADTLLA